LTWQRVLPSTEEEFLQQLEQKAKREERQQAIEEKAKHIATTEQHATNAQEIIHTDIVATFGRKAREAALAAGATMEQALEAKQKATTKAEASMADAVVMRE